MQLLIFEKCDPGFLQAWKNRGFVICETVEEVLRPTNELINYIACKKQIDKAVYVFTFDFYPSIAEACYKCDAIYVSWVWDSPHMTLWSKKVRYKSNRIFLFDRDLYTRICNRGIDNVYYLPLAMDSSAFMNIITEDNNQSRNKWQSDVSFVGNLYNDKKTALFDNINYLPLYIKGYIDALISCQSKVMGCDIITEAITENVWKELFKYIKIDLGDNYEDDINEVMIIDMIQRKVSQIERMQMCSTLSRLLDFSLYTGSDTSYDPHIINKGYIDYLNEMPLVFHYSKINIQLTIRPITSGMSERVLDVLGCEGFLLTNYQPEIAEYFENGKELVMYNSMEDMCMKIAYYLEHEEERLAIAHAGYVKACRMFSYDKMVSKIIDEITYSKN